MTRAHTARHREWLCLAVIALPCVVVIMDPTVLFLAMPMLTADVRPSQVLKIVDIYGFTLTGSLITTGRLGDRTRRRRLLLVDAAAFEGASVVAAYSATPTMLIEGARHSRRGRRRRRCR